MYDVCLWGGRGGGRIPAATYRVPEIVIGSGWPVSVKRASTREGRRHRSTGCPGVVVMGFVCCHTDSSIPYN